MTRLPRLSRGAAVGMGVGVVCDVYVIETTTDPAQFGSVLIAVALLLATVALLTGGIIAARAGSTE